MVHHLPVLALAVLLSQRREMVRAVRRLAPAEDRRAMQLHAACRADAWSHATNAKWESHRPCCALEPSSSQYLMASQELLNVHNAEDMDQKGV